MILAEPAVRQRLELLELAFEELAIKPKADTPRETEKPDWAKDIVKAMA